jgi:ClpX C4-type zinc finger
MRALAGVFRAPLPAPRRVVVFVVAPTPIVYKAPGRASVCGVVYTLRMFVRWQSGKSRAGNEVHLRAILVEAVRVGGRPVQRHIAYLGGITESKASDTQVRCRFWTAVLERLNRLSNRVSENERQRIIATIGRRVDVLTQEQCDEIEHETKRRLDEWAGKINLAWHGLDKCKFCDKKKDEVETLFIGNASAICNECLDRANEARHGRR